MELKEKNQKILTLLETLQEYERAQSLLQSSMVDGYMEMAEARRSCVGTVCPELIASPKLPTRKFYMPNKTIGENPIQPFISGVSEYYLNKIQSEFELSLKTIITLVSIVGQINEQISELQKETK